MTQLSAHIRMYVHHYTYLLCQANAQASSGEHPLGDMEIDIEEDEINEIMEAEDTDGDGTLDFDEFLSLLNGAGAGRELVEVFEKRSYKLSVYSAVRMYCMAAVGLASHVEQ